MKLSPAQRRLLEELPCHCVTSYEPSKALVKHGLAKWAPNADAFSGKLLLTPAGKKLLKEAP